MNRNFRHFCSLNEKINSCYILKNKLEKDVSKKHKSTFFQLRQKHVIIKFICQKLKEEMIIFLTLHNSSLCFRNNIRKNKRQSLKTILMLTCHLESKRKLPLTKTSDTRLIMLECYFTGDGCYNKNHRGNVYCTYLNKEPKKNNKNI